LTPGDLHPSAVFRHRLLVMSHGILQTTTLRYNVSVLPCIGCTYISAGVRRSSSTALPEVAKRSLRAMSLRAKVSRPPAHFAQPFHRGGTPKRGTVQGPRAQNSPGGGPPEEKIKLVTADIVTIGGLLLTTLIGTVAIVYGNEEVQDFIYGDGLGGYSDGISFGDFTGAALWAGSLYYASPVQLLLLFLGRIDTDRPSDWVLKTLGRGSGLDVEALDYEVPLAIRATTAAVFVLSGIAVASLLTWAFGDETWAVSTGVGAAIAAGVYELGRPQRLSVEEAQAAEDQAQEFAVWADCQLSRSGRCHVSEINSAFRTDPKNGKWRSQEALPDRDIVEMIANWAPEATRSSSGYYKGVSVKPRVDPFTGRKSQDSL